MTKSMTAALLLTLACLGAPTVVRAAEIVLEPSAVQKLVRQALFKDRGRLMLLRGVCEAYLADPVVTLPPGRVRIAARLAGRVGANAGGACMGVDVASGVTISGVPMADGGTVHLKDVRIDVADPAARGLLDQLGMSWLLPTVIDLDVQSAVQTMLTQNAGDLQATVDAFSFQEVAVAGNRLSMKFDFRLLGR